MRLKVDQKQVELQIEADGTYVEIDDSAFVVSFVGRKRRGRKRGGKNRPKIAIKGKVAERVYKNIKNKKQFAAKKIIKKVGANTGPTYNVINEVARKLGFKKYKKGHEVVYKRN